MRQLPSRPPRYRLVNPRVLLEEDDFRGQRVRLIKGRRAAKYGHDRYYEVRVLTTLKIPVKEWDRIVVQTPSKRRARRTYERCLMGKFSVE